MLMNDPQVTRNTGVGGVPVSVVGGDVDLHRVDVAAQILACKQEPPEVDALLVAAAAIGIALVRRVRYRRRFDQAQV